MAELSAWLMVLLLTPPGTVLADTAVTPTPTMSRDNSSLLLELPTADTTNKSFDITTMLVTLSSRTEQDNVTTTDISVTGTTDGSSTETSPNQHITTNATTISPHSGEGSPTESSLIPSSLAKATSSTPSSSDNQTLHTQVNNFTAGSTHSSLGLPPYNSSSELPNDATLTQEHVSQKTSLSVTTGYLLSQSSNTEPSSTYQSSSAGTVYLSAEAHTTTYQSSPAGTVDSSAGAHTTMLSTAKASKTATSLDSTAHVSAESSSMPGTLSAIEQMIVSIPVHLSTSDSKTSVLLSETTVLNRDVVGAQVHQSLLHKYQVTKTALIAVSVGSGLLILFLLVTIAVLCCTRRTCKQSKAKSSQAASSFSDGSQLHSWEPCLPRPSIRPSVYREVSVELRENLPRRQRSIIEQSRTVDAANHERIKAIDGKDNEGFSSDASVDVPKQPTAAQAGGHKSPPVTFGPVSVVTISATTPRYSQPATSSSPTSLPSETKALTMPRLAMAATSSAQSETQPFRNESARLDASNGDSGRGQPQKKRRDLVYF